MFLDGLLGCLVFEIFLQVFDFLLMLSLLSVNALDKSVHHIVEGAAGGQGAALEEIGVGVGIEVRRDTGQQRTDRVVHGKEVTRVVGSGCGYGGRRFFEDLRLDGRFGRPGSR